MEERQYDTSFIEGILRFKFKPLDGSAERKEILEDLFIKCLENCTDRYQLETYYKFKAVCKKQFTTVKDEINEFKELYNKNIVNMTEAMNYTDSNSASYSGKLYPILLKSYDYFCKHLFLQIEIGELRDTVGLDQMVDDYVKENQQREQEEIAQQQPSNNLPPPTFR